MIPELETYFEQLLPRRGPVLADLEQEALREDIPIIGPLLGQLLQVLVLSSQARLALELGTATGYSAIWTGEALARSDGRLISLEHDPALAARATANIARAGLSGTVEIRTGDAVELLAGMSEVVDFAFLDIDKEGYLPALAHLERLVRPGGLLVADNVGFAAAAPFNEAIAHSPAWAAAPLVAHWPLHSPNRDAVCIAVRR